MIVDAGEECPARRRAGEGGKTRFKLGFMRCCAAPGKIVRRDGDENLAFAGAENLLEGQMTFAFFGFEISRREELAKPAIGGTVGRVGYSFKPIDGYEPCSDQKFYFSIPRLIKGAHHAGK